MDQVRALQDSTSQAPVQARYPLRGRDPDRNQTGSPPPGWPGSTEGSIWNAEF
jgi:hypothetical protein